MKGHRSVTLSLLAVLVAVIVGGLNWDSAGPGFRTALAQLASTSTPTQPPISQPTSTNTPGPQPTSTNTPGPQPTSTNTPAPTAFNFAGFFPPVGNPPTLNSAKAGQTIPVKFSLHGYFGLNIFAMGSPFSVLIACPAKVALPLSAQATSTTNRLTYDASSDQYTYLWKTNWIWAGTCRQLTIRLSDGTDHIAYFRFR